MLARSRRGLLALTICGLTLLLSACGAGFSAQTSQIYTAGIGSNHEGGPVEIHNAVFVDNGDGTATLSVGLYASEPGGDTLTDVAATDGEGNKLTVKLADPVDLAEDQLVSLGTKAKVYLTGGGFRPGYMVTLTLTFANAAPIEIKVPVDIRGQANETDLYDRVAKPKPKPSPTPSPGATPSAEETPASE